MTEPRAPDARGGDAVDVVVVGSGMGGLTAGALLARFGLDVLVVERGDTPGGYTHAFKRGDYMFDAAVRWTGDREIYDYVLSYLGVDDRCELIDLPQFYRACYPDLTVDVPRGIDAAVDALANTVPAVAPAVRAVLALCQQTHREAHDLPPRLGLVELDAAVAQFPTLFANLRATVDEVFDRTLQDQRARAAITAPWPFVGSPPHRLQFATFAQFLFSHAPGVVYCRGSFQRLVDALVAGLRDHGGELRLDTAVEQILVEDGRATGVTLAGGETVRARAVVSNADAHLTFEHLVGVDRLPPRFVRTLGRLRPSLSAFNLYVATDLDLADMLGPDTHEIFLHDSIDHRANWERILEGVPASMFVTVPTLADPSVAPPGEHIVSATAPLPYDIGVDWAQVKDRYATDVGARLERIIPGFRDHVTYQEVATPVTLERYTLNHEGSYLGWELTPDQAVSGRPRQRTPVEGLYLSGHWTNPGGGTIRVLVSAMSTAILAAEDLGAGAAVESFVPPGMPPTG